MLLIRLFLAMHIVIFLLIHNYHRHSISMSSKRYQTRWIIFMYIGCFPYFFFVRMSHWEHKGLFWPVSLHPHFWPPSLHPHLHLSFPSDSHLQPSLWVHTRTTQFCILLVHYVKYKRFYYISDWVMTRESTRQSLTELWLASPQHSLTESWLVSPQHSLSESWLASPQNRVWVSHDSRVHNTEKMFQCW